MCRCRAQVDRLFGLHQHNRNRIIEHGPDFCESHLPKKLRLLNSNFKLLTGLILLCRVVTRASSAVWQWSVEAKREHPENGVARAFLSIPPDGKRVRGVG